jgi:hypothetical protein
MQRIDLHQHPELAAVFRKLDDGLDANFLRRRSAWHALATGCSRRGAALLDPMLLGTALPSTSRKGHGAMHNQPDAPA